MNSKDSRTWKDWQRVLYVWRYHYGHSGLSINVLTYLCKRPTMHLLREIFEDPYANWSYCPIVDGTVFRWIPWTPHPATERLTGLNFFKSGLRRFPPSKCRSIYHGKPQKRIDLGGVSLSTLRQAARGRTKLLLGGGRGNVWV